MRSLLFASLGLSLVLVLVGLCLPGTVHATTFSVESFNQKHQTLELQATVSEGYPYSWHFRVLVGYEQFFGSTFGYEVEGNDLHRLPIFTSSNLPDRRVIGYAKLTLHGSDLKLSIPLKGLEGIASGSDYEIQVYPEGGSEFDVSGFIN